MSGPVWNCLRTDFRRRWRGRNIADALGILLLVGALQLAMSLGVQRFWATPGWLDPYSLMTAFSLYSPLTQALTGGYGSASPKFQSYLFLPGIVVLTGLACRFLLPAAAASSIAPDREKRRISELIVAGLTPEQILVAKGMAAVLPFLALAAAALIAWCVTWQLARADPWDPRWSFSLDLMIVSGSVANITGLLVSAAIHVCISGQSRRTSGAMVASYSFECLLVPALYLVSQCGWTLTLFTGIGMWLSHRSGIVAYLDLVPQLMVLFLRTAVLCLLWPRALRALAYPD